MIQHLDLSSVWAGCFFGFIVGGVVALMVASRGWESGDDNHNPNLLIGAWIGGIGPVLALVAIGIAALVEHFS